MEQFIVELIIFIGKACMLMVAMLIGALITWVAVMIGITVVYLFIKLFANK